MKQCIWCEWVFWDTSCITLQKCDLCLPLQWMFWPSVSHLCISNLSHHWLSLWLVASLAASHYLNKWPYLECMSLKFNKNYKRNESRRCTVYPKKYAHGFLVLCFVVVMQSFIMNSHEVFFHIHQGCFAGTGAIVRLPQCLWSKPDGYGKISQCITTTKHSKAKTVCIFLGIYCIDILSCLSMLI